MCSEWQPIETAPHDVDILLAIPPSPLVTRDWSFEAGPASTGKRYSNGASTLSFHGSATHWMPLPDPPVVDHPRPTTPVVDHEGGGSERQDKAMAEIIGRAADEPFMIPRDPQATRISELEAEVAKWKAGVEMEGRQSAELEAEVERLKGAVDVEREACAELAKEQYDYCRSRMKSAGDSSADNLCGGVSAGNYWGGCADTASIIHRHILSRSTAMNKGGE